MLVLGEPNIKDLQETSFSKQTKSEVEDMVYKSSLVPSYVFKCLLNKMICSESKCGVLIISSMYSRNFIPGYSLFCSSKSFISNFGKGLSFELEGLNVDVLTYEPGYVF